MRFNKEKWNAERIPVEAAIKQLKHAIRTEDKPVLYYAPGDLNAYGNPTSVLAPTGDVYRGPTSKQGADLAELKALATGLYGIRAASRGREHPTVDPEWAERRLFEYELKPAAA